MKIPSRQMIINPNTNQSQMMMISVIFNFNRTQVAAQKYSPLTIHH